jgi:hypothetical protein
MLAVGFMFASADRVNVVGYTAGDYTDMMVYPHKAAGMNVAHTMGEDFTAVWTDGGTTWGFSGGDTDELVNMKWSNGTYGVTGGLNMPAGGDTSFDLGFGTELMGWDVGFQTSTEENAATTLNARGAYDFWAFDTVTFAFDTGGCDTCAEAAYTTIDLGMYGVQDWGTATGMFGMGFMSTDRATGPYAAWNGWTKLADGATLITTDFSVESTLTDWCDLRIGYNKTFNMGPEDGEPESYDAYNAGLGFNYGSVQLDMTIEQTTLSNMVSNPINYVYGRNDALAASWTLSYTW